MILIELDIHIICCLFTHTTEEMGYRVCRKMKISVGPDKKEISVSNTFQKKKYHNILEDDETDLKLEMVTKNTDQDFKWTYLFLRKCKLMCY